MSDLQRRPRILLSNDDGARAPGLLAAYEALRELADVTVVAPADQRSGASHTITLEVPLRARPLAGVPGYMVDFTPADSVKLALKHLLDAPPDLVVSGINRGNNAGQLVHYSGTVAAAKEAALEGHRAVAFSLCEYAHPDFTASAHVVRVVTERLLAHPLPVGVVLNVNVPAGPLDAIKGFRWCRQSLRRLGDTYERREDPRRMPYYWLTGAGPFLGEQSDDDMTAVNEGYVALTPLTVDWTHEALYREGGGDIIDGLNGVLGRASV